MSYSASRLTLYAILSAIEEDLRWLILEHLENQEPSELLLGQELWTKCKNRFEKDTEITIAQPSLRQLLLYADFGDLYQVLNLNSKLLPDIRKRYLKEKTGTLEKLVPVRNRVAHSRPLQPDDLATTLDVANGLKNDQDVPWEDLRATLSRLEREPSFVLRLQIPAYDIEIGHYRHNLPTPDFDETGFLGRKQQVSDVIKACLGPYPVITIVGDGGIGKTALALKVAYEILDSPSCPFEAVIWTTSKTTLLTPQQIKKIEDAISDSLGMLQNVAYHLAGNEVKDPLDEVLTYLKTFRILLVLDNLETVLDDRIRSFLEQLPIGSKVLITSRIGLGALDFRYKLQPMEENEAVQLLRALAKIRGVTSLARIPNNELALYCKQMKNNPGYVKWFVSAVQVGRRPEEVLANPDIFLDFCMSNVYQYLSEESRHILRSMLCLPGQHSQSELAFLNDTEALDIEPLILELLTTNMIITRSVPTGSSIESLYELSDLARLYLLKHHPVEPREYDRLNKRNRQLIAAIEQIKTELASNPYSIRSFTTRSKSERIVAKYLLDALDRIERKNYSGADDLVDRARRLAPQYFEVHRVDAWLKEKQGNISAAHTAYEAALELEPKSLPLKFRFGMFLLSTLSDAEAALPFLEEVANADPDASDAQLGIARARLWLGRFDEARLVIDRLLKWTDLSAWNQRKAYYLHLQFFHRKADYLYAQKDRRGALGLLVQLKRAYSICPPSLLDDKMKDVLSKAIRTANKCSAVENENDRRLANELAQWLNMEAQPKAHFHPTSLPLIVDARLAGTVAALHATYGFIRINSGQEIFFHQSNLLSLQDWRQLSVGNRVTFVVGKSGKGYHALEVTLLAEG